jgi:hypothetical protein
MRACLALALGCIAFVGCSGDPGPKGDPGDPGKQGERGDDGTKGANGAPGANGKDGAEGIDGTPGKDGARGPTGELGPAGPKGARGPAGGSDEDSGTERPAYEPSVWIACNAALDIVSNGALGQDGIFETSFVYRATLFVGGDVDVQCTVGLGSVESASGGAYFPAPTNGAAQASCLADLDYPPIGGAGSTVGEWKFETTNSGPRVSYHDPDPGHPLNNDAYTFTESDCTLLGNRDGVWRQSTIAAVFH